MGITAIIDEMVRASLSQVKKSCLRAVPLGMSVFESRCLRAEAIAASRVCPTLAHKDW
jgi:hypothetical protein|uniref:Uncharacterized protein n=2 Tax=Picea TaxID=3328 RepID=A0A101M098_PICGL|nr:hypothetical protein ABT39_MTgene4538 [Picea glauca]QHR92726.1 hypothetical protein Q903MT_gene6774 [Picea sitchensis]